MKKTKTTYSSVAGCLVALCLPHSVLAEEKPVLPFGTEFAKKLNIYPEDEPVRNEGKLLDDLLLDTDKIIKEAVGVQSLFNEERLPQARDSDSIIDLPIKLVKLRVLNKITAQSEDLILESGVLKKHGTLHLRLYDCANIVPPKQPNSLALLEISESSRQDFVEMSLSARELQVGKKIFFGWMFASSPAVSSLQHPVYDITVQECEVS